MARLLLVLLLAVLFCSDHLARANGPATQTIRLLPVADQTLDAAPFQVIALASSGLPVDVAVTGPASIFQRKITLTGTGTVTVTATQAGNGSFAPATAQETFQVNPALPAVSFSPQSMIYGMPVTAAQLGAAAVAVPIVDTQADVATVTSQLNTSQLTGGSVPTVDRLSPLIRYEGSTMAATTDPNGGNGIQANGSAAPLGIDYRVVFTCDCQQFEWVMESRQSSWRLWVDGQWATVDENFPTDSYPAHAFYRVQFPDKRPRQIKILLTGNPPFYGLITTGADAISAPQVPVGQRVIIMGDSWTGPTISPPLLPPAQVGLNGSGFAQWVGEFFNWDYWVTSAGGEGFNNGGGVVGMPFSQRALTDICGHSPDAVMVVGGTNDGNVTAAQMQTAAGALIANVQNCLSGVPIYLFGPQAINTPVSQGVAAAAAAAGSGVFYEDMSPSPFLDDPANWLYGAYNDPTVGNSTVYLGVTTQGTEGHPTPLGHDYVAERIEDALMTQYPALVPRPYTLFAPAPVAGTSAYSVQPGALLPAGQSSVTATFTPADGVHYAVATSTSTWNIAQATSSTQLNAAQPGPLAGQPVTLSAVVAPQIAGVPTGSIAFSDGGVALATVPLSSGSASYTYTPVIAGAHTYGASYSGDSNFLGSAGSAGLTATVAPPSFSFTTASSTLTVKSGQTALLGVTVTPAGGLSGSLSASCSGLPQYASCALSGESALSLHGQPVTAQLQIATGLATAAASSKPVSPAGVRLGWETGSGLLAAGLWICFPRRRIRWFVLLACAACAGGALGAIGCGGTASVPAPPAQASAAPGTYQVTLTLTQAGGSGLTQSQPIVLVIQ